MFSWVVPKVGDVAAAEIDAMLNDRVATKRATHKWFQLKQLLLDRIEETDHEPDTVFCTQEDLMAEHGVSYTTVSRALSELVREGYLCRKRGVGTFVTPRDQRLRVAGAIGLLVWDRDALEHPAFSRLVAGLGNALRGQQRNLSFVFADAKQCAAGELAPMIQQAKINALVVPTQPMLKEEHLRPVADAGVRIVPINLDCPHITPCAIHYDIAGSVELATTHLIDRGYRRVILMVQDDEAASKLTAGYQAALREAGVHEQIIVTELQGRPVTDDVLKILGRLEAPTGLVARDDTTAMAIVHAAEKAGWVVPDQLGVVGIGNFLQPELFATALTTIHVPFDMMGQLAAEMALDLLAGRTPAPAVRRLSPKLIARDTTDHDTDKANTVVPRSPEFRRRSEND